MANFLNNMLTIAVKKAIDSLKMREKKVEWDEHIHFGCAYKKQCKHCVGRMIP